MIFYTITASMPVKPDWASISGDLKAGTPLSIGGKAANDDAAFGLVQEDTAHGAEYVKVVYAGVADLSGASKSCGSAISDDAVQAMNGLTFIYGGKIYNVVPSGLPDSSEASQGDVLTIGSSGPEWDAPSGGGGGTEILYLIDGGGDIYINTKADGTGDAVTIANAVTALLANPTAYVFADPSQSYAPAFAYVTAYDITVTLSAVNSSAFGSSLVGEVVHLDAEDPTYSSVTPFVITSAS